MTPPAGNPVLQVRLEPTMWDRLRTAAGEGVGGKMSGMSLFVRRLIYRELREPLADADLADLIELSAKVEAWAEKQVADSTAEEGEELLATLSDLVAHETDLIRLNFARQLCGQMASMLYECLMLKVKDPPGPRKK